MPDSFNDSVSPLQSVAISLRDESASHHLQLSEEQIVFSKVFAVSIITVGYPFPTKYVR